VQVIVHKVEAAEVDEMWSFVDSKRQQRWLWHAIDHHTGQVLAYVFGTREDETFLQLQELLAPFGITGYALKAGQLTYDCRYSTMHGMPVTGGRGFRGLKLLWYNGVPP
jgi:hypothetical protein